MKISHNSFSVKFINKILRNSTCILPGDRITFCTYFNLLVKATLLFIFCSLMTTILILGLGFAALAHPFFWLLFAPVAWFLSAVWVNLLIDEENSLGIMSTLMFIIKTKDKYNEWIEAEEYKTKPAVESFTLIKGLWAKFKDKTCILMEIE